VERSDVKLWRRFPFETKEEIEGEETNGGGGKNLSQQLIPMTLDDFTCVCH